MRMIEQFLKVLTKILFNKESENYNDALGDIENASKTIVGLDFNLLEKLSVNDYLNIGDKLVASGKFEEIAFAIHFVSSQRQYYSFKVFQRVGNWFDIR